MDEDGEEYDEAEILDDDQEPEDSFEVYQANYLSLIKQLKRRVSGKVRVLTTKGQKIIPSNLDAWIVIQGPEGSGKSNLAFQIARSLTKDFSFQRNMLAIPDASEVQRMSDELPKYEPIILDEAITALYKRDFGAQKQKELIKFANICRKRNQYFFMCVPRFYSLDKDIRERVLLNIQIPSEQDSGIAIVNKRDDHPNLVGDKWHADISYDVTSGGAAAIRKKRYKRFDLMNIQEKISMLRKGPCFIMPIGYIYDEDLDKEYNEFVIAQKALFAEKAKIDDDLKIKKESLGNYSEKLLKAQLQKSIALMAASGSFTNEKGVFDKDKIGKALYMDKSTITRILSNQGITPQKMKLAKMNRDIETGDVFAQKTPKPTTETALDRMMNKELEPEMIRVLKELKVEEEKKV